MQEISLDALEAWYLESLQTRFRKEHKILTKFFSIAEKEILEARATLKNWKIQSSDEGEAPLDEKSVKIMERFLLSVGDALNEIPLPSIQIPINYDNCIKFIEGIKKVYMVYNSQGRKSIPRFGKSYKVEIKEIDMHLRRLGDNSAKINKFLIKNYKDGRNAELITKRIPQLQGNIERLGALKQKNDEMEKSFLEQKAQIQNLENQLLAFSEDPDLKAYEQLEKQEQTQMLDISEFLKYRKALKKMDKMLEKTSSIRGITQNDIRPYMKESISSIVNEGPKTPNLRQILIKVRILLEDESDPLQLKSELRLKILENIHEIVGENKLEPMIQTFQTTLTQKETLKQILNKKGIESQRKELKDKLAILTQDLEHFENDLNRRKREYRELLEKIGADREDLQATLSQESGEEVKIRIVIPT